MNYASGLVVPAVKKFETRYMDLGCAKWCAYAMQCLGLLGNVEDGAASLCQRIIEQMKILFGRDEKRINHALAVLKYAEQILTTEPKASGLIVRAGAILHDIGIKRAEEKYNSSTAKYQELEGPPDCPQNS